MGHAADLKMKVGEEREAMPSLELREGFVIYRVPRVCRVVSGNSQVKLTLRTERAEGLVHVLCGIFRQRNQCL